MKHSASLLAVLAIAGLMCSPAFADLDNLDIGGKLKMMGVYSTNTLDFDDDQGDDQDAFMRTEAHLWFQAELAENVTARVSLEVDRAWSQEDAHLPAYGEYYENGIYPRSPSDNGMGYVRSNYGTPEDDDLSVFLEEAYIKVADLFGMPGTITIGRQFVEIGDGFVFGDSLPFSPDTVAALGEKEQDPFDAIKIDYELAQDWLLTLIWAKAVETRGVNEDVDAYMANLGFYGLENHVIEVYYLFVLQDGDGFPGDGVGDVRAKIHQVGIRGEGELVESLMYHAELTSQLADEFEYWNDTTEDIGGWAGEVGVKFAPASMEANEVAFGFTFTYLSGDDDPNDEDYDAYIQVADNRTFGEIADYFNGLVSNSGDFDYTGVMIFNVDAQAAFTDRLKGALEAYYFIADEDVEFAGESDDSIGWEIDAFMNYEVTEDLSAMLAAGFFDPDDAAQLWNRDQDADDMAWFVRGGVSLSF